MLFNDGWTVYEEGKEQEAIKVNLPDDRMIHTERKLANPGAVNISYHEGGKYVYTKEFNLSLKEDDRVYFEFEGVYRHPTVYINGIEAAHREYGYTSFIFEATDKLKNGKNAIKVIADNSSQPNSRWYTGSGIYRPVHMWVLPKLHILPRSIKITTVSAIEGEINLKAAFSGVGKGKIVIKDGEKTVYAKEFEGSSLSTNIIIENPRLWNVGEGNLYELELSFEQDVAKLPFGIREIKLDKGRGFLINGERVILKGACIHHDNGLLGAICDEDAEKRRARILFESGYNAIRSAHNPISRYFLDEADRLGLLVLDEYADEWYIHKTRYDCASFVTKTYKEDLSDMVAKDYNHPSVIMYSLGNEVAETSEEKGIAFVKEMIKTIKEIDSTRPITCGVNIFFNALYSLGFGIYSDKKAEKEAKRKPTAKRTSVGSQFFNDLVSRIGATSMKIGTKMHLADVKTKGVFEVLDVAGYNYGISRYKKDLKRYSNRFILGSETFCADASSFMELAKDNPRIIGDFVWSGWDYLGEAGIGSWVALTNKSIKMDKVNWLLAGSGRIDILGHPSSEMDYTKVAFSLKDIALSTVSPRDLQYGHSPSAWKLSWAHRSYSYEGYEGKKMEAEIYSLAPYVALFQNEKIVGKRKRAKDGRAYFKLKYVPGTLKAVSYDKGGKEIASTSLKTGGNTTVFLAIAEKEEIRSDETVFINLSFTDENGMQKPLVNSEISVTSIENAEFLGLGNACPYYPGTYLDKKTKAYYGRAMAIIRPIKEGDVKVSFLSPYGEKRVHLIAKKAKMKEDYHI